MRAAGVCAVLAVCGSLSACGGGDSTTSRAEVVRALSRLPYAFRYRLVPIGRGLDAVVAGRATDARGASVDFAVLIGKSTGSSTQQPVVPYVGMSSGVAAGNALVITNDLDPYPEPKSEVRRRGAIGARILDAVLATEPAARGEL